MIKPGRYYTNWRYSGIHLYVKRIIETNQFQVCAEVRWFSKNEKTGRLIDMDIEQEMWISKEDVASWHDMGIK